MSQDLNASRVSTVSRGPQDRAVVDVGPLPHAIPDVVPGHWTTPEGREMAERYATMTREQLGYGDKPDLSLANAVFLVDRYSLDLGALQQAAKERIRWLSVQLAIANQRLADGMGWAPSPPQTATTGPGTPPEPSKEQS